MLQSVRELESSEISEFNLGQKYAFLECLEFLQIYETEKISFNLEELFPLWISAKRCLTA